MHCHFFFRFVFVVTTFLLFTIVDVRSNGDGDEPLSLSASSSMIRSRNRKSNSNLVGSSNRLNDVAAAGAATTDAEFWERSLFRNHQALSLVPAPLSQPLRPTPLPSMIVPIATNSNKNKKTIIININNTVINNNQEATNTSISNNFVIGMNTNIDINNRTEHVEGKSNTVESSTNTNPATKKEPSILDLIIEKLQEPVLMDMIDDLLKSPLDDGNETDRGNNGETTNSNVTCQETNNTSTSTTNNINNNNIYNVDISKILNGEKSSSFYNGENSETNQNIVIDISGNGTNSNIPLANSTLEDVLLGITTKYLNGTNSNNIEEALSDLIVADAVAKWIRNNNSSSSCESTKNDTDNSSAITNMSNNYVINMNRIMQDSSDGNSRVIELDSNNVTINIQNKHEIGGKGSSELNHTEDLNISNNFVIDYNHNIDGGDSSILDAITNDIADNVIININNNNVCRNIEKEYDGSKGDTNLNIDNNFVVSANTNAGVNGEVDVQESCINNGGKTNTIINIQNQNTVGDDSDEIDQHSISDLVKEKVDQVLVNDSPKLEDDNNNNDFIVININNVNTITADGATAADNIKLSNNFVIGMNINIGQTVDNTEIIIDDNGGIQIG